MFVVVVHKDNTKICLYLRAGHNEYARCSIYAAHLRIGLGIPIPNIAYLCFSIGDLLDIIAPLPCDLTRALATLDTSVHWQQAIVAQELGHKLLIFTQLIWVEGPKTMRRNKKEQLLSGCEFYSHTDQIILKDKDPDLILCACIVYVCTHIKIW